ncbi:MAG: glycosyltransferase [Anaerovoracaceae bacterium]
MNTKKFNIDNKAIWRTEIRGKYNIPEEAKVFIFVGRITKDKGINELLAASRNLFEEHNDMYLLMVGPE